MTTHDYGSQIPSGTDDAIRTIKTAAYAGLALAAFNLLVLLLWTRYLESATHVITISARFVLLALCSTIILARPRKPKVSLAISLLCALIWFIDSQIAALVNKEYLAGGFGFFVLLPAMRCFYRAWIAAGKLKRGPQPSLIERSASPQVPSPVELVEIDAPRRTHEAGPVSPAAHSRPEIQQREESAATTEWYYDAGDNTPAGPVTLKELVVLRSSGRISEQTRVWTAGMENWNAYSKLGLPVAVFEAREPSTPKHDRFAAAIARVNPVRIRFAILILWLLASLLTVAMPHCRFIGPRGYAKGDVEERYDFVWHHERGERREVLVGATIAQEFAVSIACAILFAATYISLSSKVVSTGMKTGDNADVFQPRT